MVLVSNEWQNSSNDENTTAPAATETETTSTNTTTASEVSTETSTEESTSSTSTSSIAETKVVFSPSFSATESTKSTTTTTTTSAISNEECIKESTSIKTSTVASNEKAPTDVEAAVTPLIEDIKEEKATHTIPATARNNVNANYVNNVNNGIDKNSNITNENHLQQPAKEAIKPDYREKRKIFHDNLKQKEIQEKEVKTKDINATTTKVSHNDNEPPSALSNNWQEHCSYTDKNYEKIAMESLKQSWDDDNFVEKILEGVDNAMNQLNDTNVDTESICDSTASTLMGSLTTSPSEITSRAISPSQSETARNILPSGQWNNDANKFACDAKRFTPNRKVFNRKNFFAPENQTKTKGDSSNVSDVTVLPTSNVAGTPSVVSTNINSTDNIASENDGQAKIVLLCEPNSHPFQTRTIYLTPNIECMVGRLIAKSKAGENNAIFDCKVLSRKHAVIWYTPDGKFWVKDTKSSNGTFINDNKLGDAEAELHFNDIVKFGVDVLENSRKEVHGCIIACVKLYLPDGRETISIDSQAYRSQCMGAEGGRITYDELNRLNMYIQETASREKLLTTKLCTIQNTLDATRKNSELCWQAMITEDQLLHRIHSLEKKLQFMEKNVPENVLRNEVLKLMDDKTAYQLKTKEALRKMYQERNDAMQMFTKMENAYVESDNECAILREQIDSSTKVLQDVNSRLIQMESEYSAFREECVKQQQETKEREEKRIEELSEQLRQREEECIDLKRQLSANRFQQQEQQLLEKQAIEKLDAAFADIGDSDGADDADCIDIDGNKDNDANVGDTNGSPKEHNKLGVAKHDVKYVKGRKMKSVGLHKERAPPQRVNESVIMKWLKNSDINKTESTLNIFKAICDENEHIEGDESYSDDESSTEEKYAEALEAYKKISPSFITKDRIVSANNINDFNIDDVKMEKKCTNFTNKLKVLQKYLKQLEAEIENETNRIKMTEGEERFDKVNDDSGSVDAFIKNKCTPNIIATVTNDNVDCNDCESNKIHENSQDATMLSKTSKSYLLLRCGVNMLREAYIEIKSIHKISSKSGTSLKLNDDQETDSLSFDGTNENEQQKYTTENVDISSSPPPPNSPHSECEQLDLSDMLPPSLINHVKCTDDIANASASDEGHQNTIQNYEIEAKTVTASCDNTHLLEQQLHAYEIQVEALTETLKRTELEAEQTLEIIQDECENAKQKVEDLTKTVQQLLEEKEALEKVISENNVNKAKTAAEDYMDQSQKQILIPPSILTTLTTSSSSSSCNMPKDSNYTDVYYELNDAINDNSSHNSQPSQELNNELEFEREEELITYKERLEEQEQKNIELRHQIDDLKLKTNQSVNSLAKTIIPCGAVALALFIYFLNTYTY